MTVGRLAGALMVVAATFGCGGTEPNSMASQGQSNITELQKTDAQPGTGAAKANASATPEIKHVILERRNGRDRLVTELSTPATFRVLPNREGVARLEISGASIAPDAVRHLEGDSGSAQKLMPNRLA